MATDNESLTNDLSEHEVIDTPSIEHEAIIENGTDNATSNEPHADKSLAEEVYIDDGKEAQSSSGGMSEYDLRQAFKEERVKRKAKAESEQKLLEENQSLKERIDRLESNVGEVLKTYRPRMEDYETEADFYNAMDQWYAKQNHGAASPSSSNATSIPDDPPITNELSDEQAFHLYQHEQQLQQRLPDYPKSKAMIEERFDQLNGKGQTTLNMVAMAAHTLGLDPAKIFYALDKIEGAPQQLLSVAHNPAMTRMKLVELENKVKFRQKQNVSSAPEINVNQSGSLNSDKAEVDKAYKVWEKYPTAENHQKLRAARDKLKSKA